MTFTIPQLILAAAAILVAGFLIHKYLPGSAVAKAEAGLMSQAEAFAPAVRSFESRIEGDASHLLAQAELWLTDDSAANAKLAQAAKLASEANADKAARQAALRQHIAALQAKLPPA